MKVLVVEDEDFAREYLASLLAEAFDFDEVVQAKDGEEAWELFQEHTFEFIVTDLILPKLDGLKLAQRILEQGRGHRILALSSECDDFTVRQISRCGILGFIWKKEMSREILDIAFREVFDGRIYYSPEARIAMDQLGKDPDAYFKVLSNRELQVIRAIAQRKSHEQIAEELGLSKFTVRRHRHNAMHKLNLKNESSLLHYALDKGITKHKGGLDWSEESL